MGFFICAKMKLRAWDKTLNRWRDEFDWVIDPETWKPHWIHDRTFIQGEATQLVLCRSTGIFGIDGVEIYEGDFLGGEISSVYIFTGERVPNSLRKVEPKQVIWMNDCWGYSEKQKHLSYVTETEGIIIPAKYFSVIGNIFENPEWITKPLET
jgi:uncharacterized phage protein (TIGR01671 family)